MVFRKPILILIFCSLFTTNAVAVNDDNLDEISYAQLCGIAMNFLRTFSYIAADSADISESDGAKKGALLKLAANLFDGGAKITDCISGARDLPSTALHTNKSVWCALSSIEELKVLNSLEKEYGDHLPVSVLKKHYKKIDTTPLQKMYKQTLYLVHLLSTISITARYGSWKNQLYSRIIASICSFLIYLDSYKKFISKNRRRLWTERISAAAASAWDIGYSLTKILKRRNSYKGKEPPFHDHKCPLCEKEFGKGGAYWLTKCRHWVCEKCGSRGGKTEKKTTYNDVIGCFVKHRTLIFECPVCCDGEQKCLLVQTRELRTLEDEARIKKEHEEEIDRRCKICLDADAKSKFYKGGATCACTAPNFCSDCLTGCLKYNECPLCKTEPGKKEPEKEKKKAAPSTVSPPVPESGETGGGRYYRVECVNYGECGFNRRVSEQNFDRLDFCDLEGDGAGMKKCPSCDGPCFGALE
jgi:hypothetical protein